MPLDSQVQALLEELSKQGLPPFEQMSPTFARSVALSFRDLQGEPEAVGDVRDILVPAPAGRLPVRLYHPEPDKKLPLQIGFIPLADDVVSVGVVGALQYDVITSRLRTEYGVEVDIEPAGYTAARWLASGPGPTGF